MEELDKTTTAEIPNPVPTPTAATYDPASVKSLIVSSLFAAGIALLPHEEDADGNRYPAVLFKGQFDSYQYFVTLVVCGMSASFSSVYTYNRPGLSRFLRSCSVFFLSCAVVVLIFAISRGYIFKTSASPL